MLKAKNFIKILYNVCRMQPTEQAKDGANPRLTDDSCQQTNLTYSIVWCVL